MGNNVTIKNGVYLWDGITIEDDVQIGANVTFTNDKYPRANSPLFCKEPPSKKNASIGAGSVILGGITIGQNAMIGAGSVVTKDIPADELWVGSPANLSVKYKIMIKSLTLKLLTIVLNLFCRNPFTEY